MLQKIGKILGGDPHKREIERLSEISDQINLLEEHFESLSDAAITNQTVEFRHRLAEGETLDDILPEAYATVREASKRTIGLRHYDVQLIGGTAIHEGTIVEMRTGEGKTLVATLPIYLNALTGDGVHLITVNDYLARRDARWMAPIFNLLGLSVGVLQSAHRTENGRKAFIIDLEKTSSIEDQHQMKIVWRKEAYQADITYGTNNEFGFDYLRDNLTMSLEARSQRKHHYAIIDEVDNVLIDEARTPLIISGPASEETEWYVRMAQVVKQLSPEDFEINERDRNIVLTEIGEVHIEELLEIPLRDPERPEDITPEQARLLGYLEQAMRAQYLYKRNKEYLVQGGKVMIVDEFTGRLMPGRRWSEGLHQAVEAKEGVKIEPENITYATITLQNYFRMYEKLAGMTGTALTEAEEFDKIYKLDVLQLPTNLEYIASQPETSLLSQQGKDEEGYRYTYYAEKDSTDTDPVYWKRKDYPDVVYRTEEGKLRAITQELLRYHVIGRPQLVGTTSVEHSDRLSIRLGSDLVRRLAQVLILRKVWQEQHNIDFIERSIPELEPLNKPLSELPTATLRQIARQLNISLNPEEEGNLATLQDILGLELGNEERLQKALQGGIPHKVLNARKHDEESQIIAHAGAFGAITIATNMAGRGVDIKLGGELTEELIADVVRVLGRAEIDAPYDMTNEERREALKNIAPESYGIYEESVRDFIQCMQDMTRVREVGGLHVIGSERHEARRIDNQLRGRAARQGDPGSSRFYLSLEDDLMRIFGGQQAEALFSRLQVDENLPIEHNILGKLVEQSQERVEGSNFDVRKHLLEYDDVLNTQRQRIYGQRDMVFTKQDLTEDVLDMMRSELQKRVPEALQDEEGPWKLLSYLEQVQPPIEYGEISYPSYPLQLLLGELKRSLAETSQRDDPLRSALLDLAHKALDTEREHLFRSTRNMLERSEETLELQREERFEILENFEDSMQDLDELEEVPRPQDILTQIIEAVRVPLKLNNNDLRDLLDGEGIYDNLRDQIDEYLTNLFINRMGGAIERRLEESLDIKPGQLRGQSWEEASHQLFQAMETILDRRAERLLGDQGLIAKDLDVALGKMDTPQDDDRQMILLLRLVSQGKRMSFDPKTHRQRWRQFNRLNYINLVSHLLEDLSPEIATADVLEHLNGALASLKEAWGKVDWERLVQNEATLQSLDPRLKTILIERFGDQEFSSIATDPLTTLDHEQQAVVQDVLGTWLQNEVLRQLLLRVISEQWVEYLTKVEALRVSIGMEAYAQRNPLVEYKAQATELFRSLLSDVRAAVLSRMFIFRPQRPSEATVDQKTPPNVPTQKSELSQEASASSKKRRKRHKKN
jgi:preprotein translocase subunit SecA